jgi:hypothetical protein
MFKNSKFYSFMLTEAGAMGRGRFPSITTTIHKQAQSTEPAAF